VPEDMAVDVEARVGAGEIRIFDRSERSGANVEEDFSTDDYSSAARRVDLRLAAGFGTIEVERAS
jgi:predicted membrane protein